MERAAVASAVTAAGLALVTGSALWHFSSRPETPHRPLTRLGLAPEPRENRGAIRTACLKASVLLSRRARRTGDRSDEQAMLAMSHVLDALHRSGIDSSGSLPDAVLTTLTRLVDQLERNERGGAAAGATR